MIYCQIRVYNTNYKIYSHNSDKVAKIARSIRSFSSTPPFASETKLRDIATSKFAGDRNSTFLINFIASILSISFFNNKSNDLEIYGKFSYVNIIKFRIPSY